MDDSQIMSRKTASSGRCDYGDPVVIHETSKTKVVLVPFFINHDHGSELTIKLTTYKKGALPFEWCVSEDKCINLNDEATLRLHAILSKLLAVNNEEETGNYIALKLNGQEVDMSGVDPQKVTSALVNALSQKDLIQHLKGAEISSELANALRYSVRLSEMKTAMAELRLLLDTGEVREQAYQEWCEKHPWSFGNQFIVNEKIRNISSHDQVDMLMPRILAGYRDIVELKRPNLPVLAYDKGHRNHYFSSDVSKAIGQCHRYLDVFTEVARNGLIDCEQIVAYHPEATIVIGRSNGWSDEETRALHGLNARLNGIRIITYDHLFAQGENLVGYLSNLDGMAAK